MSMIDFMLSSVEHEKSFINLGPDFEPVLQLHNKYELMVLIKYCVNLDQMALCRIYKRGIEFEKSEEI